MTKSFTNNLDIPLGLAVWLVNDDYDYINKEGYISATSLMRPLRQIILGSRVENTIPTDLADLIPRSLGNAIHDSVEKAWTRNKDKNLKTLGYPESVVKNILVNPSKDELENNPEATPIYIELRGTKKIGKYTLGGKFDLCIDGVLHDIKTTSTYKWVKNSSDDDYQLQGSLYRYLHPEIITSDYIRIMFVFTDWQKAKTSDPNYPQSRIEYKDIPLMSIEETEKWIKNKLSQIDRYINADQKTIPECTKDELWMSDPVYKYYANPEKMTRATKNFDSKLEANGYLASRGKGIVVEQLAEPKRCAYCPAFEICEQKDKYFS